MMIAAPAGELRKNIEYSRFGDLSLRLDARIPEGTGPFPAVIIVHGGGWVRGDRVRNVEPLFEPLQEAGIASFSISYRLAQDVTQFGAAIQDVDQAVRWLKAHAAEYRVDPERIALVGESAGAQLASMAALQATPETAVRAVVALYSPSDLVTLAKSSEYIPAQIRNSVKGTPFEQLLLAGLAQLSPVTHVRRDMPPFLFIHGTADHLVPISQSEQMCAKMRAAGAAYELYPVPGGGHGIVWWEASPSLAGPYKREMVRWLRQQFAPVNRNV